MTARDRFIKRSFDLLMSGLGLALFWPVIVVTSIIARFDTGGSGIFRQERIGRDARPFKVAKLRTMRVVEGTTVTTADDPRITRWGARFRRWKLDEVPQFWNVFLGQMSFVGPRPDVAGYMDQLTGTDRRLLQLRPGVTGPASLKYRDEESILASVDSPETYNDSVIWPDKVRINLEYLDNWSFRGDLAYIWKTLKK